MAVSKRVQKNSGMERTSLLLIVRKGGRERQEKKVKKKKRERERENRYGPKSHSRPTSRAKWRSLQIKFYFQKTSSKFSLNAYPARRYPASTQPLLFRAHTYLTGQTLFNMGIQLYDEEKRQFSGPTSTEISLEPVLFTRNTAESRAHQLVGFLDCFLHSPDRFTSRKPLSFTIQTVCQHPKTAIGCLMNI